ncbi:MAG TPA: adenylate/guanylate cyclase domain-containing protein [Armatimonadota bacterium]|nr:adenylate/guanylate cyclase domain-containing protein [Armatimonadota bacterium]
MPAAFRFCGICGRPLPNASAGSDLPVAPAVPGVLDSPEAAAPNQPARRRVAILFADLCGSTALGESLEPERAYRLLSEYLDNLGRIITETGGYVVKTLGDGIMALFGAPHAHGDDPERAGRAGLRIQEWMAEYGRALQDELGVYPRARVGINYGSVVAASITAGGRPSYDALGDAVNVAQRMESSADPGAVCVSDPFYRLTLDAFDYEQRGARQVKGKKEPVLIYWLVRERPADGDGLSTRIAAAMDLPLVGREDELAELLGAAHALQEGQSALITITGPRGVGKSRILDELAQELTALGIPYLTGILPEGAQDTPLYLWRRWLMALLGLHETMSHAEAAEAIAASFVGDGSTLFPGEIGYNGTANAPEQSWAEWLAALAVDPQRLSNLDPETRARVSRDALRALLAHWQRDRPAALLIDEAEHLDSLSLDLLFSMIDQRDAGASGLLVALAGRELTVDAPPRGGDGKSSRTVIQLGPLSPDAAEELLRKAVPALTDGTMESAASAELCRKIVERSGGDPLFLDLMVRAARQARDPTVALMAVPDTLYGLVQARLDALSPQEQETLHLAAALRMRFAERWLAALQPAAQEMAPPWRVLEAHGFLEELTPPPGRELKFRSGAIQEVLYESLLQDQRRKIHARIAPILSREAEEQPEAQLEEAAAWHWRGAGDERQAIRWTLLAAERAACLYEGSEAIRIFDEALANAVRTTEWEMAARAALGLGDLCRHRGDFGLALGHYEAALGHLDQVPQEAVVNGSMTDAPLRARILRSRARAHALTGGAAAAAPLLAEAIAFLSPDGSPDARRERARCQVEQAHTLLDLGQPETAARAGEEALAASESAGWNSEAAAAGAALGRIYDALGRWPEAEAELRRAAARAEDCGERSIASVCNINLGNGLRTAGRFSESLAAYQKALIWAEQSRDVEKEALIWLNLGAVHLSRGDWTLAERTFRAARADFEAMAHHLGVTVAGCNLCDTLRLVGRIDEAGGALDAAAESLNRIEAPFVSAHLMVCRAELALARGDLAGAADLSREALRLAKESSYESGVRSSQRALGRAMLESGDAAGAARQLEEAIRGFDDADERLDAALSRADLAAARAGGGDHSAAVALLEQAAAEIRRLGADPWLEKIPIPAQERAPCDGYRASLEG